MQYPQVFFALQDTKYLIVPLKTIKNFLRASREKDTKILYLPLKISPIFYARSAKKFWRYFKGKMSIFTREAREIFEHYKGKLINLCDNRVDSFGDS